MALRFFAAGVPTRLAAYTASGRALPMFGSMSGFASEKERSVAQTRRRRTMTPFIIGGVALVFLAGLVWTTRDQAPTPHYQNRVAMPGMGDHPVSLWLDPKPHRTGQAQVMAQVADPTGSAIPVSNLVLTVIGPDQTQPVTIPGEYTPDGRLKDFRGAAPAYVATIDFDRPGTWQIGVQFNMADAERRTVFQVEVSE